MIRLLRFSIVPFIKSYLPPHKRQTNRLILYDVLAQGIKTLMDEFISYRNSAVLRAYVTNETISMEWYLNELFDATDRRIYIDTATPDGVPMGLNSEPTEFISIGLTSEPSDFLPIPLPGEDSPFGNKKFAVFIPAALSAQAPAIGAVVKTYKLAGKTFTILEI